MELIKELEMKLREILDRFRESLRGIRGGRPTSKLVEDIAVECYGQTMAVKQLGSVTVILPREINVSLWDPTVVAATSTAIEAFLNVHPIVEGNLIRVNLPPLSGDRRNELAKVVKKEAEEARIRIRGLRDEVNKKIARDEEAGIFNEDDRFRLKEQVQKHVDESNRTIEELVEAKVGELEE